MPCLALWGPNLPLMLLTPALSWVTTSSRHTGTSSMSARFLSTSPFSRLANIGYHSIIPQIAGSKHTRDGNLVQPSSGPNATDCRPEAQETQAEKGEAQGTPSLHITHKFVEQQFRAGPTDGFCNFKGDARNDGRPPTRRTLFAYELKAPHKLPWGVIERAGLASNTTTLDLRQDVWERSNRNEDAHDEDAMSHDGEGEDPFFATTGVITQLYDFMIRKQTR